MNKVYKVGLIGCGDTYTVIYCYARLKKYSIYHSGLASAGSGMKTEKTGPLYSTFRMIKKRVESICKIKKKNEK